MVLTSFDTKMHSLQIKKQRVLGFFVLNLCSKIFSVSLDEWIDKSILKLTVWAKNLEFIEVFTHSRPASYNSGLPVPHLCCTTSNCFKKPVYISPEHLRLIERIFYEQPKKCRSKFQCEKQHTMSFTFLLPNSESESAVCVRWRVVGICVFSSALYAPARSFRSRAAPSPKNNKNPPPEEQLRRKSDNQRHGREFIFAVCADGWMGVIINSNAYFPVTGCSTGEGDSGAKTHASAQAALARWLARPPQSAQLPCAKSPAFLVYACFTTLCFAAAAPKLPNWFHPVSQTVALISQSYKFTKW